MISEEQKNTIIEQYVSKAISAIPQGKRALVSDEEFDRQVGEFRRFVSWNLFVSDTLNDMKNLAIRERRGD